jgi:hypothetical protein
MYIWVKKLFKMVVTVPTIKRPIYNVEEAGNSFQPMEKIEPVQTGTHSKTFN